MKEEQAGQQLVGMYQQPGRVQILAGACPPVLHLFTDVDHKYLHFQQWALASLDAESLQVYHDRRVSRADKQPMAGRTHLNGLDFGERT